MALVARTASEQIDADCSALVAGSGSKIKIL
uniref:Uncharacterized protein n=1 Tax=Oryza sativa subsp. japonica TaxID=39947 RepID=Q339A0_ORYSJ|nr:hypothetical protein LOC_Os10g23039 [Oryza sativa Japonica Group]